MSGSEGVSIYTRLLWASGSVNEVPKESMGRALRNATRQMHEER